MNSRFASKQRQLRLQQSKGVRKPDQPLGKQTNAFACSFLKMTEPHAKKLLRSDRIQKKRDALVEALRLKLSLTEPDGELESQSESQPQNASFVMGEARECVRILPGIGNYDSSDSSSNSSASSKSSVSDTEPDFIDFLGWGLEQPYEFDKCFLPFCDDEDHDHASLSRIVNFKQQQEQEEAEWEDVDDDDDDDE